MSALRDSPVERPATDRAPEPPGLFRPGANCWQVALADQAGLLVDGDEYFSAVREAIEAAEQSILILAWDFDSRAALAFDSDGNVTVTLGELLNRWVKHHPDRHVYVLTWDYPVIYGFDREFPPIYGLGWRPERRIRICYDNVAPIGASQHQKVVVMDDRVAFCGGMDLASRRWDSCAHRATDSRRSIRGKGYPPVHDAMMAVSGPAARALGDLARDRWRVATGETLEPASPGPKPLVIPAQAGIHVLAEDVGPRLRGGDESGRSRWRPWARRRKSTGSTPWPPSVPPAFTAIDVAISRTMPATATQPAIREVEALYLDQIRAAERSIYIENQYLTSQRLGEALAERLREPDGPEVVVVLRLLSHGWLETVSMERLRTALIRRLREADLHRRFQVYYPHVAGLPEGQCLDIHSKVMIVDDRILRIGSANFANRSMGFDSECDLSVEAGGRAERAATIRGFRHRLLAEHLGVDPAVVAEAEARLESVIGAIDALAQPLERLEPDERTLSVLETKEDDGNQLSEVLSLADPEHAVPLEGLIDEFQPSSELPADRGSALLGILGIALVIAALAAMWRWTPLSAFANGAAVVDLARRTADSPWTIPALIAGYVVATFVMFPRPLLTVFGVLAYRPWLGFTLAMIGILAATVANYLVGRRLPRRLVRRFAGPSLNRVMAVLRSRGVLAMTALRLVPIAPFAVPGIVAGAAHVRLREVLLGTALGNLPGILLTTVLADRLEAVLRDPRPEDFWLLAGVLLLAAVAAYSLRRSLSRIQLPTRPG